MTPTPRDLTAPALRNVRAVEGVSTAPMGSEAV